MDTGFPFVATCARAIEPLLADELRGLGATDVAEHRAALTFGGDLAVAYRACLWSRVASRVLMPLASFPAATPDELYAGMREVPWEEHLAEGGTLAIDAVSHRSAITHTRFASQKAKDAVVDRFRELTGARPDVDLQQPDLRINLSIRRDVATVAIDLSGDSLHRRGYREPGAQTEAPLKETLAAAVLLRAGWPEVAASGGALLDPLCGSGTLLIEGAMMASDVAPGLLRERFGFSRWLGHDDAIWAELLAEAEERRAAGLGRLPVVAGWDGDARAVELARASVERAGLGARVAIGVRDLAGFEPPAGAATGLVVTNPPYGVRIGEAAALKSLYASLGGRLLATCDGWHAAILTSDPDLAKATGLRANRWYTLYNGAMEVRLYTFEVSAGRVKAPVTPAPLAPAGSSAAAEQFANRLRKNARHLGKWAKRTGVTCWRVYDADLPDYAVAVDRYETTAGEVWAHVAEYAPPAEIDPERAAARLRDVVALVPEVLDIEPERVVLKERRRQRGTSQYEKVGEHGRALTVAENGLRFEVNLTDHLDTGLFLDHRDTRAMLREMAEGARFLNLFAYTGVASVYAAAGGAAETTTVDMSGTYLAWAKRNMGANGFAEGPAHRFVRADALEWPAAAPRGGFDLVFLDPPTFSNSTRMGERTFDVQRDHVSLLRDAARLLAPEGTLVFSTNARRFRMDAEALPGLEVTDITKRTIPEDFARNPRVHGCWVVRGR